MQIYFGAVASRIGVRDLLFQTTKRHISTNANAAPVSKASSELTGVSLLVELNMSKENAARRNHVGRKLRSSKHIPLEIKGAIQVIIDLLNPQSDYAVAWPSAKTIASRIGKSRRSGLHYVKIIKALGIFHWKSLSPEDATNYCERKFGVRPKLERCGGQAPNLFFVNEDHPLWNSQRKLPEDVDREMGKIVRRINTARNTKTTSLLATDPSKHLKRGRKSLSIMRQGLRQTLELLQDDVANEDILRLEEADRWCREELLNDVANDITDDVANDTQVFRRSSYAADEIVTPQEVRHKNAESDLSVIPSPKGAAVRQPCSQSLRADTPPARQSASLTAKQTQSDASIALAASECRSAPASFVVSGFAAYTKSRSTVPVRHKMSGQGMRRIDGELFATMTRLEVERREEGHRLTARYAGRLDADVLDSVSLAVRCPSFATGRTQGRP